MSSDRPVSIAYWGGPGTGKSSYARGFYNYYRTEYPGKVTKFVREYPTDWLNNNSLEDWHFQKHVQEHFIEQQSIREIAALESDVLVTECPVPLCCFWAKLHGDSDENIAKYDSYARTWFPSYNINVLMASPNTYFPFERLDIRPTYPMAKAAHSDIIDYFFKIGGSTFLAVYTEDIDAVNQEIMKLIEG